MRGDGGTTTGWLVKILLVGLVDAVAVAGLLIAVDNEAWGYTAVLAVTGQPDAANFVNQGIPMPTDRDTRLICLDRATGKERWAVTPKGLPDAAAALRTLGMSGSPLAPPGRVVGSVDGAVTSGP